MTNETLEIILNYKKIKTTNVLENSWRTLHCDNSLHPATCASNILQTQIITVLNTQVTNPNTRKVLSNISTQVLLTCLNFNTTNSSSEKDSSHAAMPARTSRGGWGQCLDVGTTSWLCSGQWELLSGWYQLVPACQLIFPLKPNLEATKLKFSLRILSRCICQLGKDSTLWGEV